MRHLPFNWAFATQISFLTKAYLSGRAFPQRSRNERLWKALGASVVGLSDLRQTDALQIGRYTTFMKIWGLGKGAVADRMIAITCRDWAAAVLRSSVLLALLIVMRRVPLRIWGPALALFVAADLGFVVDELNPRMPRRFFDPPPIASTCSTCTASTM